MTTTTDGGSRRDLLPLDLGPAAALRSYARLGLVAVVIPALVAGLLAAIYATATRAPAIVIVGISACAMVFLLDIGSRGLRGGRDALPDLRPWNSGWSDRGNRATPGSHLADVLHEAASSTGSAAADPHAPVPTFWYLAAQNQARYDVREQVRKATRSLYSEVDVHAPRASSSTLNTRALAILAVESAGGSDAGREMFQQAITIDASSVAHPMLVFAIQALHEGDRQTARELFQRAIEISSTQAASSGPR